MFIELAEYLKCPAEHEEAPCVLAPREMLGRRVIRGVVGCPSCRSEYAIERGIVHLGDPPPGRDPGAVITPVGRSPEPETVQALLGLTDPGGYVVLVGAACWIAAPLTLQMEGVRYVGVNAPPDVGSSDALSLVTSTRTIPLRTGFARGVVVGGDYSERQWLDEAARVLHSGRRLVALTDRARPEGVTPLTAGPGLWVGERAPLGHSS